MRTAISIPPFTDASTIVEMAVDAESAGWDGVFLWDHMQWDKQLPVEVHDRGCCWGRWRSAPSGSD